MFDYSVKLEVKLEGKRAVGRLKRRLTDWLEDNLKASGISIHDSDR